MPIFGSVRKRIQVPSGCQRVALRDSYRLWSSDPCLDVFHVLGMLMCGPPPGQFLMSPFGTCDHAKAPMTASSVKFKLKLLT